MQLTFCNMDVCEQVTPLWQQAPCDEIVRGGDDNKKPGYRPNVGMVVLNEHGQVLLGERLLSGYGQGALQFAQGGVGLQELPIDALYREFEEEVGLPAASAQWLAGLSQYCHYDYEKPKLREDEQTWYCGQKQLWALMQIDASSLAQSQPSEELGNWQWVSYWHPLSCVVDFKLPVYQTVLAAFAPFVFRHFSGEL